MILLHQYQIQWESITSSKVEVFVEIQYDLCYHLELTQIDAFCYFGFINQFQILGKSV